MYIWNCHLSFVGCASSDTNSVFIICETARQVRQEMITIRNNREVQPFRTGYKRPASPSPLVLFPPKLKTRNPTAGKTKELPRQETKKRSCREGRTEAEQARPEERRQPPLTPRARPQRTRPWKKSRFVMLRMEYKRRPGDRGLPGTCIALKRPPPPPPRRPRRRF